MNKSKTLQRHLIGNNKNSSFLVSILKSSFFCLLLTFAFTSCSDDSPIDIEDTPSVETITNDEQEATLRSGDTVFNCLDVFNSENPFDYYGEYHNLFMDYIVQNAMELDTSDMASSITEQLDTFIRTQFPPSLSSEATTFQNELSNNLSFLDDNSSYFDTIAYSGDFFDNSIETFMEINSASGTDYGNHILELQDLINSFDSTTLISDGVCSFKEWESAIDSLNATNNQKDFLYQAGSIARHSFYYWTTEIALGNNSIWSENNTIYAKPPWWKRALRFGGQLLGYDTAGFIFAGGWVGAGASSGLAGIIIIIF